MRAQVVIPKGWRRVPPGKKIEKGDLRFYTSMRSDAVAWLLMDEYYVGGTIQRGELIIRRMQKAKHK